MTTGTFVASRIDGRGRPAARGNRTLCVLAGVLISILALDGANRAVGQQAPANFIVHPAAKPIAETAFADESGRTRNLSEFRGRFVLLNIWATWCGPCRKEMPTLDRLQERLGGGRFQVIALSIDRGGAGAVRKFYAETGVRHLAFFIDATGRAGTELALIGLPGTLLINPEGREVGRLIGPAEWDSPEMIAFLESRISRAEDRRANALQPAYRNKEAMQ